ncbi:BatA and WFA domain-containing protein [Cytobacillus sp. IB215665]|uniref:vWA domain-containing protein n=1 Tax=Cytobacillus sp. IB215665 TaxID=3097357 RepID=UPI002A0C46BA|nr:BatA and WFA domain-containing protein [Cytobacillus sp. IB215665]MDX8366229.1 BatA and WFA domain-containing protein [Cytobacillus sp. IB215665]
MGLIAPTYLLLSIFLLVVIAFYLFRKKYQQQVIPSTLLWQQVMQEWEASKWWRRLQRHILLYLQLLILSMIIIALAQPYFNDSAIEGDHIVIVVDTSASMSAKEKEERRIDIAKNEIAKMIDKLQAQKVTIIGSGKKPEILLSQDPNKQNIRKVISDLQLSYENANIAEAIQYGAALLADDTGEIQVFSDSVMEEDIATMFVDERIVVNNIGTSTNNISLRSFGVGEIGDEIRAVASVANDSASKVIFTINIESNGKQLHTSKEEIEPKTIRDIQIPQLPEYDYYKATIHVNDDYQLDNSSVAFMNINDDPTVNLIGNVSPFISKALVNMSKEVVQADSVDDLTDSDEGVYIVSNLPEDKWPDGPLMILSPTLGGSYEVKEKVQLEQAIEVKSNDPLFQFVNMNNIYVQNAYPLEGLELSTIASSGKTDLISKGTYEGHPIIFLSMDIEDSDWPLHASFPIFLYNAVTYLTEQNSQLGYFSPGEVRDVSLSTDASSRSILNEDYEVVKEMTMDDGVLAVPNEPGIYRFIERGEDGQKEKLFAVILEESEKKMVSSESFVLAESDSKAENNTSKRHNVASYWFILIATMILIVEWEVYRRGIRA